MCISYRYLFGVLAMWLWDLSAETSHHVKALIKNPKSYIAIVWPITPRNKDHKIEKILKKYGHILYEEEQVLTPQDATNLLRLAHPHITNITEHVHWYFPPGTYNKKARIYITTFDSLNDAVEAKHKIRRLFDLQYRSIHINDTHLETIEFANYLFNRHKSLEYTKKIRILTGCLLPLTRSGKWLEPMVLAGDPSGSSPTPFEPQITADQLRPRYSCTACEKSFARHYNLNNHLKVAHANRNQPCDLCNKKFATLWEVKGHRESVHCTNMRVSTLLLSSPSLPAPHARALHQRPIKRRAVMNQPPPPPDPLESFDPYAFAFANPYAEVDITIRSPMHTAEVLGAKSPSSIMKWVDQSSLC